MAINSSWAKWLAIAVCLVMNARAASASGIASDNASSAVYNDGWQNGDNGGSGWGGPWQLSTTGDGGQNGHFVFDSNANGGDLGPGINSNPGNRAWGMYSNSLQTAAAVRPFSGALTVGQTFSIDMDNGFLDGNGSGTDGADGVVGFGLQNAAGQNLWEFYFTGGDTNYTVNAIAAVGATPGFTDRGLHIEFTLNSPTTYQAVVTQLSNNAVFNLSGSLLTPSQGTQAIDRVRLFSFNAGADGFGSYDAYFNNIAVPEPAGILLTLVGVIGLIACRRRI